MASPAADDQRVHDTLRSRLAELDGAEHVLVGEADTLIVVCRAGADRDALRNRIDELLEGAAAGEASPYVDVVVRPQDEPRRRVRLDAVHVRPEGMGLVTVRVALEWGGAEFTGESTGEGGHAIEVRTAAAAAVDALNKVSGEALRVRLVGVKLVRAFDADLLVVALMSEQSPPQKLVGAVLVGANSHRAAASAVLHATNRILGNYIAVG